MNQRESVLALLRDRRPEPVTSLELLQVCGTLRAAARVHELRRAGHPIATVWTERDGRRRRGYVLLRGGGL